MLVRNRVSVVSSTDSQELGPSKLVPSATSEGQAQLRIRNAMQVGLKSAEIHIELNQLPSFTRPQSDQEVTKDFFRQQVGIRLIAESLAQEINELEPIPSLELGPRTGSARQALSDQIPVG